MSHTLKRKLVCFIKETVGVTMVEYAFLLAFIALVCILGATRLGQGTSGTFQHTAEQIDAEANRN